jgi:tetratricopeptide (TPR) repeat protein
MLRRPRALAAVLASVLTTAPVMAQPKSPNRPPKDVATDLVKQAIAKSQQGNHLDAIELYLSAYSLDAQHTLLSNVGNEYQQAGKPVEALKYFCMYLEKDPTGTNATYATSKAKALQIELGNKKVDDKSVCEPPSKNAEPPDDQSPADGVSGTQGLDQLPPGDGKKDTGGSPGATLKIAGVAAGVVGLAGVGLGTYFGLKAKEQSDIISNHDPAEPWPDDIQDIEAEGKKYEQRQILLTIAGGALTATGVVLFIVGSTRTQSTEKLSIRPTATGSSVGIAIGRGF